MPFHQESNAVEQEQTPINVASCFTWEQICTLPINKLKESPEFECMEDVMHLIAACSLRENTDEKLLSQPCTYRLAELLQFISQRSLLEINILRKCYFELWQKCYYSHCRQSKYASVNDDVNKLALRQMGLNEEHKQQEQVIPKLGMHKANMAFVKRKHSECTEEVSQNNSKYTNIISDNNICHLYNAVINDEVITEDVDCCNEENNEYKQLELEEIDEKERACRIVAIGNREKVPSGANSLSNLYARNAASLIDPHMCSTLIVQLTNELQSEREKRKVLEEKIEEEEVTNKSLQVCARESEHAFQKLQKENSDYKSEIQKWKDKSDELQLYNKSLLAANDETYEYFFDPKNMEELNKSEPTNNKKIFQKIIVLRKREQILLEKLRRAREKCTLAELSTSHWVQIVNITLKKMKDLMASSIPNKSQKVYSTNRHSTESLEREKTNAEIQLSQDQSMSTKKHSPQNCNDLCGEEEGVNVAELKFLTSPATSKPTTSILLQHKDASELALKEENIIKFFNSQIEQITKRGMLTSDIKLVMNMRKCWQEYFSTCYAQKQLNELKLRVNEKDAFINTLLAKINILHNEQCKCERRDVHVFIEEVDSINKKESITPSVSAEQQQIALYVQRLNEKEAEIDLLETHLAENQEELQKYHNYVELMYKASTKCSSDNTNLEELNNLTRAHETIEYWANKVESLESINMELLQHLLDIQQNVKVLQIENDSKDRELEVLNTNSKIKHSFAPNDKLNSEGSNNIQHECSYMQKTLFLASLHEQTVLQKRVAALEINAKKTQMELLATRSLYAKCRTTAITYKQSCYIVYKNYIRQVHELCEIVRANRRRMEAGVGMRGAVMLRKQNNELNKEVTRLQNIVKELTIRLQFSDCVSNSRQFDNLNKEFAHDEVIVAGHFRKKVEISNQSNESCNAGVENVINNSKNSPMIGNNNMNNENDNTTNPRLEKATYKQLRRTLLEYQLDKEYAQSKIHRLEEEIQDLSDELQKLELEKCYTDVSEGTIIQLKKLQNMMVCLQSCELNKENTWNKKENDVYKKRNDDSHCEYAPTHSLKATYDAAADAERTFNDSNNLEDKVKHRKYYEERRLDELSKEEKERGRILSDGTQYWELEKEFDNKSETVEHEEELQIEIHQLKQKVTCLNKQLANNQVTIEKLHQEIIRTREQERHAYQRLKEEENKSKVNEQKIAEMQKVRDEVANSAINESTQALTKLLEQKNVAVQRLQTELNSVKSVLAQCEVEKVYSMEETYERLNVNNKAMLEKYSKDLWSIKKSSEIKHLLNGNKTQEIINKEAAQSINTVDYNMAKRKECQSETDVHDMRINSSSYESIAEELHALTEKVIYLQRSLREEQQVNVTLHNLLTQIETSLLTVCKNYPQTLYENCNCMHKQNKNGKMCSESYMSDMNKDKSDKENESHTLPSQIIQELVHVITAQEILLSSLRHQLSKRDEELTHERKRVMLAEEQLRNLSEESLEHLERRPYTKLLANSGLSSESTTLKMFERQRANKIKENYNTHKSNNNDNAFQTDISGSVQRFIEQKHQSGKQFGKELHLHQEKKQLPSYMMEVQESMIMYLSRSLDDERRINEEISNIITISEKVELAISILRENVDEHVESIGVKSSLDTSHNYTAVMHRIDVLMKNISNIGNNLHARITEMQIKTKEYKEKLV